MSYNLHKIYGPIISDDESNKIFSFIELELESKKVVEINFEGVVAMSTKSAKRIFGTLYSKLNPEKFYERIHITNASKTLQEIIYDAITNYIDNN
ncbi:MAG: hypothetical protein CMC55_06955 [Flavobacteriaceae bacterium]|uniref:STAS-like domain-containing protein n=1 Tax=Bizionia echini TaxID=649333 RepID=UPI000C9187BC|nr:hypothetical protein [Flavobacteriaceae bacterium]